MAECWARCLGGCKGKISGEHIVTESLWKGDRLFVKGLQWCRETGKNISVRNFTSNILCQVHNSMLSNIGVDDGGSMAFKTLRQAGEVSAQRIANLKVGFRTGRFDICEYDINGLLLERWFLKTLINMELAGDQGLPIGPYLANQERPHSELVEIAFGLRQFPTDSGLYFLADFAHEGQFEERIRYAAHLRVSENGTYVAAGEFAFHGFQFMLSLEPGGLPKTIQRLGEKDGIGSTLYLLPHPEILDLRINELPSQKINVGWSAQSK